jgi:hypothetical protein
MNPLFIPVLLLTFVFFGLGLWTARRIACRRQEIILMLAGLVATVPALLFDVYYTGILGEAKWYYSFRSWPGTELTVCGVGLVSGWLQAKRNRSQRVRRQMSAGFIPFLLVLCVTVPYLKQIVLRPEWNNFADRWTNDICLQSSESSCGPAAAATLVRLAGKPVTEKQIAMESFTSRRGTENWYLIRTLRRHGLKANYSINRAGLVDLPFPAIVGVKLGDKNGAGHFITVLGRNEDKYVVGDPLSGREELDAAQLQERYFFTGFSIVADSPNH